MEWQNGQPDEELKVALELAMKLTSTGQTDPEHFVIAMVGDAGLPLGKACLKQCPGLSQESLRSTVIEAARAKTGQIPPPGWSESLLSPRSREMLETAQANSCWAEADSVRRLALLAAAAVQTLLPRVRNALQYLGLDLAELVSNLVRSPGTIAKPQMFDESGGVNLKALDPSGRAVCTVLEAEGKGMGLTRIGTPLLFFALVAQEHGLLDRGLRLQVINPRQLHENLLLHLRALGKRRFNDQFRLHRDAMQPTVIRILERAADQAHDADLEHVGEAELLKALMLENDLFVNTSLTSLKVDVAQLSAFVIQQRSGEQEEERPADQVPSLAEVESILRRNVVGQDHVIDGILPVLKRLRFGYTRPNRPVAVLLFLGNSGTGKTQLAKEIARAIYGSEEKLIFLEMGQFGTEYSKTIFVGAPPGLVGYGEGLLTNGLRDKPESVVLFDEVEKAHKSVFDVLLRFLDEGMIADPAGPVRDGRRCIIILTSNHALGQLRPLIEKQSKAQHLPPDQRDAIRAEVRRAILATEFFRPEFLNRVDELFLFGDFNETAYRTILTNLLERERSRLLNEKSIEVKFDASLVDVLVQRCRERSDEGARVCGKLVSDLVIGPLIEFVLEEGNKGAHHVRMFASSEGMVGVAASEGASG